MKNKRLLVAIIALLLVAAMLLPLLIEVLSSPAFAAQSSSEIRDQINQMEKDIRKVLEIFAGQSEVENKEESSASGVGYVLDQDWNLELFVDTNNGQRHILIDRYE